MRSAAKSPRPRSFDLGDHLAARERKGRLPHSGTGPCRRPKGHTHSVVSSQSPAGTRPDSRSPWHPRQRASRRLFFVRNFPGPPPDDELIQSCRLKYLVCTARSMPLATWTGLIQPEAGRQPISSSKTPFRTSPICTGPPATAEGTFDDERQLRPGGSHHCPCPLAGPPCDRSQPHLLGGTIEERGHPRLRFTTTKCRGHALFGVEERLQ